MYDTLVRIVVLLAMAILPLFLVLYARKETPREREARECYGKLINEAIESIERRNKMTVERFRALSGYTDDPIKGTTGCFDHDSMIFCLERSEIGKAVDYAVDKGAKDINVGYSSKDDLWYVILTD